MSSKPADDSYTENERTSHVRYYVVLVTALMAVLLYLDRFCISFAEVFIKQELNLSDAQIGTLFTAFFLVYALAQVPSGWLTDRFGPRLMLTLYILLWSACTGLIGLVYGFAMLFVLRAGVGLFQAGAYPTAAKIVSNWVPFSGRGSASSIVAVGGRLGGFLALFLTGILIVLFVPTSVSSKLELSDVKWENPGEFCYEIEYARDPTKPFDKSKSSAGQLYVGSQIKERLAKRDRELILQYAEDHRKSLEKEDEESDGETTENTKLAPIDPNSFLSALNSLITDRGVFTRDDVQDLKLDREATSLLDELPDKFSKRQNERLNRLVLEAAFPKRINKVYVAGWRQVMWTYGLVGLVVAGLFWWICRDEPRVHRRVTPAELELIEYGRPAASSKPRAGSKGIPLVRLLKSRSMWLLCISMWFTNVGWVFVVTWAPRYFQQAHDIPVQQRALMTSIPLFVGWFGMLMGGNLTDWLVGRIGLRWGRALPMSSSRFLAMLAYVYILTNPSPWGAVVALSIVAFATDLGTGSIWAFNQDVGGRHVGSVLGWSNMWGNLGAAAAPPFMIFVIGKAYNWNAAFITCGAAFLLSGILCLAVDASVPIVPPDEDEEDGSKQDESATVPG